MAYNCALAGRLYIHSAMNNTIRKTIFFENLIVARLQLEFCIIYDIQPSIAFSLARKESSFEICFDWKYSAKICGTMLQTGKP